MSYRPPEWYGPEWDQNIENWFGWRASFWVTQGYWFTVPNFYLPGGLVMLLPKSWLWI